MAHVLSNRENGRTPDLFRGSVSKDLKMKWIRTPTPIWEQLSSEFEFTIDACASDRNHLLPRYWTKETDALVQDWDNETIFCHPLFDTSIPKFIKKGCTSKNSLIVFLLPSSTNARYFHSWLWDSTKHKPKTNVEIRFIPKPDKESEGWKFRNENGEEPKMGYMRPLMIVVVDTSEET